MFTAIARGLWTAIKIGGSVAIPYLLSKANSNSQGGSMVPSIYTPPKHNIVPTTYLQPTTYTQPVYTPQGSYPIQQAYTTYPNYQAQQSNTVNTLWSIFSLAVKVISIYTISKLAVNTLTKLFLGNKAVLSGHSSTYSIILGCIFIYMLVVPEMRATLAPVVLGLFLVLMYSTISFTTWNPYSKKKVDSKKLLEAELIISKGSPTAKSRLLAEAMDNMKPYLNTHRLLDELGDNTINRAYANYTPLMRATRNNNLPLVRYICKSSKIDPYEKANGWKIPGIEILPTIGGTDNIDYALFENRNIQATEEIIRMGIREGYHFTSKQIERMLDIDLSATLIRQSAILTSNLSENIMRKTIRKTDSAPIATFLTRNKRERSKIGEKTNQQEKEVEEEQIEEEIAEAQERREIIQEERSRKKGTLQSIKERITNFFHNNEEEDEYMMYDSM